MLLGRLSFIRERFEKIRDYLVRPLSVSGRTRFRFQNDNMVIEVWCSHRPAGYLSEIRSKETLTAMQALCVADILRNSYSVVLGRVIQYSLGEGTFSGRVSSRVTISYSNTGGQLGRAPALPSTCPP